MGRQLPEGGTRSRIETLKHQLAVCNRDIQRNKSIAAANHLVDASPAVVKKHTSNAAEESKKKASQCVQLRQDIEHFESKIASVRSSQASLLNRAEALEAEWNL